ncbi:hypothetical protein COS31_00195 [Candidatus Roizmanbacteria bacterium CG02_land_8_20_14_3_00_36_15]|uniref:Antitoxin n=2 Tax=Candidatus Roizmaniibacteriota TaxID=1752723 RepID=A0A2M8KK07_9BACT|nr:MAG: hypothetical protein COS51_04990 [Candidatus Roizmanbacteria bacterium CG03_land_8_20_14_0_80_36_21]PIV38284.1 MAG: hypothetical protein COS31_00195 [Candidatus Roizmanbacteria bacterium CG02_land_8_20_14_3_00_36_15]PIY70047.1 MAG: hypothetical protein COY89_03205 [Candidatus Roizmanbacteria bacterium CG_4_10_14_0_8_um_filter_36_36]PJA52726.1 MAG: hypothetical protein CO166_04525 [Candidatus Roizmanbacteria bacterium CG_4_9_14_3_um_filter_36_11]PJC81615.1 MAG: hypothetical protein CO007
MNNIVNISEFRNNISDYINRVIYNKDSFLLKKGKSIVAKIVVFNEKKEITNDDKITKYAGILNNKEAKEIKKNIKKFRKNFRLIRNFNL